MQRGGGLCACGSCELKFVYLSSGLLEPRHFNRGCPRAFRDKYKSQKITNVEVLITLFYPAIQFIGFIYIQHSVMNFGLSFHHNDYSGWHFWLFIISIVIPYFLLCTAVLHYSRMMTELNGILLQDGEVLRDSIIALNDEKTEIICQEVRRIDWMQAFTRESRQKMMKYRALCANSTNAKVLNRSLIEKKKAEKRLKLIEQKWKKQKSLYKSLQATLGGIVVDTKLMNKMKDEIEEKSWALESEQSKVKETSKMNKDLKLKNQELREEIKNSKKNENKLETTERQIKKKLEKCEKEIKQKSDQIELDRKKWREFQQKYMLELKSLKKEKKQLEKRLKNDEKSEEK